MDDQTCRTCENCRHRYKCDEELPCLRCGPGLNYWQPNKADLARAEAPPAAEPPAPEAECARGGKMMSKHAPLSRKTVEALRDFAFAYYCEHEGPSESEHKARDLAQALDGDLSRAAQAAADPISNCMCGHCESWSDHGNGLGRCSEHHTMTVSGQTCKHARPKAEYAEPAAKAAAPAPVPPAPEKTCGTCIYDSYGQCREAVVRAWYTADRPGEHPCGGPANQRDAAGFTLFLYRRWCPKPAPAPAASEGECPHEIFDGAFTICHTQFDLARAEATALRERAEQAEAELKKARRTLQIPAWMPISERVTEVMVGHRNAEARAQEAEDSLAEVRSKINDLENLLDNVETRATEERAAGCFRIGGMSDVELRCTASTLRVIARDGLVPTTKQGELQGRVLEGIAAAIERGAEGEGVWPTRDVIRMARRYTPLSGGICLNAKDLGIPAEWLVPSEAGERTEG